MIVVETSRRTPQVRQKRLDQQRLERGMTMPSHQELSKLSDEHKAELAQRCVALLMGSVAGGRRGSLVGGASSAAETGNSSVSSGGGSETSRGGRGSLTNGGGGDSGGAERRPRANSKRGHSRSIMAAPPLCVPEVQEKTHAKR